MAVSSQGDDELRHGHVSNSPDCFPSDDLEIHDPQMIRKNIISTLSVLDFISFGGLIQFWAPVKIDGRLLLTTSHQPFAPETLDNHLKQHRLCSLKYRYDIDGNNFEAEKNPEIISGAPARAFLNRVPELVYDLTVPNGCPLMRSALQCGLSVSFVMPVFSNPSQSRCIGVFECYMHRKDYYYTPGHIFGYLSREQKKHGLYPFDAEAHISSKNICGLEDAKNEIDKALQVIVESHLVELVQVWIAYEDENNVAFSSSLDETQKKRMIGFRLTACCADDYSMDYKYYFEDCLNIPLASNGKRLAEMTLQNNEPQFQADVSLRLKLDKRSCFTICLKNNKTRDLLYVLEFFWNKRSQYILMLESLFSILKRCLPSFNLASGAQLGDELRVINLDGSTGSENRYFRILEGNRSSSTPNAINEGARSVVLVEESLNAKWKTIEKDLPLEKIEQQFEKTVKVDAQNLNGDELLVMDVDGSTGSGSDCLQILEGNKSSSPNVLDEGDRSVVLDEESLNAKWKAAEQQFGKPMKAVTQNLNTELRVIDTGGSTRSGSDCLQIFKGNRSSSTPNALDEKDRSAVLVKESQNVKWKTSELHLEKIEQQFGKTMKAAAQYLNNDELHVIDVDGSTGSGSDCLQILEGNKSSSTPNALDEGDKSAVLVDESLNAKWKTAEKELPIEKIKLQFGKTMKEAAQNLGVSVSTLKRKWNKHIADARKKGLVVNSQWPGPNYKKRKVNDPNNNHRDINDKDNGAIEDAFEINRNKNALTIKAEYGGVKIKFDLQNSSATFGALEKKIGEEFKLKNGDYKLEYLDEEEDWIRLSSDQDMEYCIKSLGRRVRLRAINI